MDNAYLVLEDGSVFTGESYGKQGKTFGELVFATGMTGYQETLTDPSYAGQIVLQTAPHIGIVGTNARDDESSRIWVAGYVVKEPSRIASNFRSEKDLGSALIESEIVGISGVDTRAITIRIRDAGAMRAGIFSGSEATSEEQMLAEVRSQKQMKGQNLSGQVSASERYLLPAVGSKKGSVAILDLGIKRSTLEHLTERGLDVEVFPSNATANEILESNPSAVFFSNGPGDPEASASQVEMLRELLKAKKPFFGICFGRQVPDGRLGPYVGADRQGRGREAHRGQRAPRERQAASGHRGRDARGRRVRDPRPWRGAGGGGHGAGHRKHRAGRHAGRPRQRLRGRG